ncbi:hypothetical protein GJAV_G00062640 [Gymnothorax javanicus]|nr:hypothetical protein GJAV_G00062640 [Gymnothorax javanicus]
MEPTAFGPSKSLRESLRNEARNMTQRLPDGPIETRFVHHSKSDKLEQDQVVFRAWETEQKILGIADMLLLQKEFRWRTAEGQWTTSNDKNLVCNSTDEKPEDELKGQLGAMITVCHKLRKRLEKKRQGDGPIWKDTHELMFRELTDSTKAAHLLTLVFKLREENSELMERIEYVQNLNSKWQKYDLSREEYVKGLCQKLKESKPLTGLGAGVVAGVGNEHVSTALLQQEIARLNHILDEKMKDCDRLSTELHNSRKQDQERIQTLEQQVLIYTEDFMAERADRERAQSKVQNLQEEVLHLKMKLRKKQERRDPAAACWVHIGHRMSAHMQVETAEKLVATADQPGLQQSSRHLAIVRPRHRAIAELQCPRCFIPYDDDHMTHEDYLKHCEECANL